MERVWNDIVAIDWEQVRILRAVSGLFAMLIVISVLGSIGDPALAALLATLFTTASSGDGPLADRLPRMMWFAVVGAVLGGLAYWSTDSTLAVALVLGIATYLGTVMAVSGPTAATAGLYLSIWPLFALLLGSKATEPWTVVVGFLVGGAIAIVITAVRLRLSGDDDVTEEHHPLDQLPDGTGPTVAHRFAAAATSPIGVLAVVRATAVVLGVVIGGWLFPDYPLWVAITVIVIVKPSADQSLSTAVQRTLGTAAGVALALSIASVLPRGDGAVAIAFLVSGTLMLAFNNANYTLFAAFLTAMLVFGQRLAEEDAFAAGWERLFATAAGAGIAVAVIAIAIRVGSGRDPARGSIDPSPTG